MQKEYVSDKCKISNTLTISKDTKVGAKGTRAMVAHTNSLVCPRAKFRPNQCKGGAIRVESNLGQADDAPITEDKVATCTHKRCFAWSSS
jgi:hypothetical protein